MSSYPPFRTNISYTIYLNIALGISKSKMRILSIVRHKQYEDRYEADNHVIHVTKREKRKQCLKAATALKGFKSGILQRESVIKNLHQHADERVLKRQQISDDNLETILKQICIDLGVVIGISTAKKIVAMCVQTLAKKEVTEALVQLGSRVASRVVASMVAEMIATVIVRDLATTALEIASSSLFMAEGLLILISVIGFVYDIIDPHKYRNMMNKEEIEAFVTAAETVFLKAANESFPVGGEFPPVLQPNMFKPKTENPLQNGSTFINLRPRNRYKVPIDHTKIFLESTAKYILALNGKPNAAGQIIDLSDEGNPETPRIPKNPLEWSSLFSCEFSASVPYSNRYVKKIKLWNACALPIVGLCVVAAIL